MITLESDRLTFRFPEVHPHARCDIAFQRTLRIPDDDRAHPLPPGLGHFPLRHLDDFASRLPEESVRRGGVVMPMHQAEALWINFDAMYGYAFAVKVATGKVCAVSGKPWEKRLIGDPQNYVVLPDQPWLDGYCVAKGMIRQFVAMPLGGGYTAEEQLTGTALHGGLQIAVYPLKRELYEEGFGYGSVSSVCEQLFPLEPMGLAPGGRMRQEIYDDAFGLEGWDQRHEGRCFVTIANSAQWMAITGERPPTSPPTARQYTDAGLPWFDYYDGDQEAIAGAERLAGMVSVAGVGKKKGESPLPENESIGAPYVVGLGSAAGVSASASGPERPVAEPDCE